MFTLDFQDRELLYSRVNERVDKMMEQGLLAEVTSLVEAGLLPKSSTAAQAIGYKELIEHIEGRCTLTEAVEQIKLSSRRYAKRQLTWFRHEEGARTITVDKPCGSIKSCEELLSEALVIADEFKQKYISECENNEGK
jgi:tRNA dimethylallyltransferase